MEINLNYDNSTKKFKVSEDDIIVKLKQRFCHNEPRNNFKEKHFRLEYDGNILDDNKNLLSYNIKEKDTVYLQRVPELDANNIVIVIVLGNFNVPSVIQVYQQSTISQMKEIISQYSNIPEFVIFKDGIKLEDNNTLHHYGFIDNCEIYAVQGRRGSLKINCLMKDQEQLLVEYEIISRVSDLKELVSKIYKYEVDDFVLFLDKECLDDNRFLFEYKIDNESLVTYCHVTRLNVTLESEPITQGTFCDIYKARNVDVIVKQYRCIQDQKLERYKMLMSELITFQMIKSNCLFVQLLAFYKQDNCFFIGMEYINGGSLDQYLKKYKNIPEDQLKNWSIQILNALVFLHNNSIIYRDLKPTNILLADSKHVKLCGFSLSKYLMGVTKNDLKRGFVQTKVKNYRYMAPEVFNNEEYGIKIDVWSFGAVLMEIVTGKSPCHELDSVGAAVKISRDRAIIYEIPPGTSNLLKYFIAQCLEGNPMKRPTADELLEDDFLKLPETFTAAEQELMDQN